MQRLTTAGLVPLPFVPLRFATDLHRECDAEWSLLLDATDTSAVQDALRRLERVLGEVVGPHMVRGARWHIGSPEPLDRAVSVHGTTLHALRFFESFISSDPGFVLLAEDSSGRQGYTHPYRMLPADCGVCMEFRVRDFEGEGREAREEHVRDLASQYGATSVEVKRQYVNMGPRLQQHPELVEWATHAGQALGLETCVQPIRGGTGVDPFLDCGVVIANLGTGYFAPESEKEFTSLQMMARHAMWLATLVQGVVGARAAGPASASR
jgi:tripeptide aminopeptidase